MPSVTTGLFSKYVPEYHPFLLYFEQIPAWDGIDRIDNLAHHISPEPFWISGFHTWMLALAAQWTGRTGKHANSVAPLLVSTRQGYLKSTFCKSLMQMADLNLCKAYQKNFRNLLHIASFIDTSNRFDLLSDTTGSRRFLCVEVKDKIDCSHIEHEQIYARLKQDLADGARYWFTAEEEQKFQEHNFTFRRHNPADEVLHSCFRPAMAENSKEFQG